MKTQHLPENDDAAGRGVTGVNDLEEPALHLRRGFGDARRTYDLARLRRKSGELKLVYFGLNLSSGGVGLRRNGITYNVDHEFSGLFDIAEGVLALCWLARAGAQRGTEQHGRRR